MSNQTQQKNQTFLEKMSDNINVRRKEDQEYHRFEVGVPLRLIFPEPVENVNVVETEIKTQDGEVYPTVEFKGVIDIEDTTQKPKPLNVPRGSSNAALLRHLNTWLIQKHKFNLEITKIETGKKGKYTTYDYEVVPIE